MQVSALKMCKQQIALVLVAAIALLASLVHAEHSVGRQLLRASDHKFKPGEDVILYANKVGPYSNPRLA